jgi:hypothetical protein
LAQPSKPDISLLTTAMAAACIEVKEVSQDPENWSWIVDDTNSTNIGAWDETIPFVHNLANDNIATVTDIGKLSRDVNVNLPEFWTIQLIGGYEAEVNKDFDTPDANGNYRSTFGYRAAKHANANPIGGVIMIFQETIRDFANTAQSNNVKCPRTADEINKLVTFHETLHTFGFVDLNVGDGDIMNASSWLFSPSIDHVLYLTAAQIKKIQANTTIN